jgi:hypothetical protein
MPLEKNYSDRLARSRHGRGRFEYEALQNFELLDVEKHLVFASSLHPRVAKAAAELCSQIVRAEPTS